MSAELDSIAERNGRIGKLFIKREIAKYLSREAERLGQVGTAIKLAEAALDIGNEMLVIMKEGKQ